MICKYIDLTRAFNQKYSFRAKSHFETCTGLVQRNKPVKLALDLIVYFSYNIIKIILKWEYAILVRAISVS